MKFVLCLLVLLPLVYCASIEDKRFIFGDVQIPTDDLLKQLQGMLGSDATEQACEATCKTIVGFAGPLVCPNTCQLLQSTVQG